VQRQFTTASPKVARIGQQMPLLVHRKRNRGIASRPCIAGALHLSEQYEGNCLNNKRLYKGSGGF
jgi:hypothetical protein